MTQFHNCTHLFIIWDAAVYRFRIPRCSMVVACINKVLVQRCTHFWSQVTANFLFSLKKCLFFLLFVYFGILQQMCKKICHDLRINDSFFFFYFTGVSTFYIHCNRTPSVNMFDCWSMCLFIHPFILFTFSRL